MQQKTFDSFLDRKPTLFTKEKAVSIANRCNLEETQYGLIFNRPGTTHEKWEYLVAPSTVVGKYCVAVIDESGEHVGFF